MVWYLNRGLDNELYTIDARIVPKLQKSAIKQNSGDYIKKHKENSNVPLSKCSNITKLLDCSKLVKGGLLCNETE